MNKNLRNILVLILLSYLFFMFGNSVMSLTNPDEVFYTLTAKEMVKQNTWSTPYLFGVPQFEKPIFLYWMIRVAFLLFGITNFAARFFPAVFGIIGVIGIYYLTLLGFKDQKKAFLSSAVLLSSGVYIGLSRTVFTDMMFTVWILLSLLGFYWAYTHHKKKVVGIILSFVCSGFAVLTKGPIGFMILVLTVGSFLFIKKDLKFLKSWSTLLGFLLFLGVALPWYWLMIAKYGSTFNQEFFYNDHIRRILEAEHLSNDTWYFYPFSMVWGMFPWSFLLIAGMACFLKGLKSRINSFYVFLACWMVSVFIIFQPAHSKLVSYVFPLFPALAVIIADFIISSNSGSKKSRALFWGLFATGVILGLFAIGLVVCSFVMSDTIMNYVGSRVPLYILSVLLGILVIIFFINLSRKRLMKSVYALVAVIMIMFGIVPIIDKHIEPFVSSRDVCAYLMKNYNVENTILCSKFFARGTRFYTDKDVAVIDIPGKQFFSPHPVLFLDSDLKVADFLGKQPVTYCLLKKSALDDIERLRKDFNIELLRQIGNQYIVRIKKREVVDGK